MERWMEGQRKALRDGMADGSVTSVVTAALLGACGARDCGNPLLPINAPSQWLWGEQHAVQRGASLRHTLTGYLVHHAASVFWAVVYERWFGPGPAARWRARLGRAGMVATMAYVVDQKMWPRRLRPGFERQLSFGSLLCVYAASALSFAALDALRGARATAPARRAPGPRRPAGRP